MLGAIIGDVIGSVFEWNNIKSTAFPLFIEKTSFTDDSVLTAATALVLLDGLDYAKTYRDFSLRYPQRGYGHHFVSWVYAEQAEPYNSWGNGSAMRVSPVGFAMNSIETVLAEAQRSAEVTHNHPEGIKGAQATALAVFMARQGAGKQAIKQEISTRFGYNLTPTLDEIRPTYQFDVSCQGSVPQALTAFFESTDFEDAIRKAVSLGGDTDTITCITGGVAHAFYGKIPAEIAAETRKHLPQEFLEIEARFNAQYGVVV